MKDFNEFLDENADALAAAQADARGRALETLGLRPGDRVSDVDSYVSLVSFGTAVEVLRVYHGWLGGPDAQQAL